MFGIVFLAFSHFFKIFFIENLFPNQGNKELDWKIKQGEFAYCIGYTYEGRGLTSKAIRELSGYAFDHLGLERLQIIAHKDNLPSVKIAINNSFKWQKTLKNEFTPTGEKPLDMELYELYKN